MTLANPLYQQILLHHLNYPKFPLPVPRPNPFREQCTQRFPRSSPAETISSRAPKHAHTASVSGMPDVSLSKPSRKMRYINMQLPRMQNFWPRMDVRTTRIRSYLSTNSPTCTEENKAKCIQSEAECGSGQERPGPHPDKQHPAQREGP